MNRFTLESFGVTTELTEEFNKLSESKKKHCYTVADFMYRHGRGNEDYKTEMYLLGLLHDIGYSSGKAKGHSHKGGDMLRDSGYAYWEPVYWHGHVGMCYTSKELDLLNYADMSVNSLGKEVGLDRRLDDILNRYGIDSEQFTNAKKIVTKFYTDKKLGISYIH